MFIHLIKHTILFYANRIGYKCLDIFITLYIKNTEEKTLNKQMVLQGFTAPNTILIAGHLSSHESALSQ